MHCYKYGAQFKAIQYSEKLEQPTEKSIQIEDLIKLFYLNNKDPDKVFALQV